MFDQRQLSIAAVDKYGNVSEFEIFVLCPSRSTPNFHRGPRFGSGPTHRGVPLRRTASGIRITESIAFRPDGLQRRLS